MESPYDLQKTAAKFTGIFDILPQVQFGMDEEDFAIRLKSKDELATLRKLKNFLSMRTDFCR